jgi:predicted porin
MRLTDAPQSLVDNIGVKTGLQTANGDASPNGKFYNGLGFAGVSNDTWGTLTFGRQLSPGADAVLSYDPMGGAAGFSVVGFSGAFAGGGDTEDKVGTTAVKYRVNYGNFHFGAYASSAATIRVTPRRDNIRATLAPTSMSGPACYPPMSSAATRGTASC